MREPPPTSLVETLERAGLATLPQIRRAAVYVHRLAKELPPFESVWVDALAQARLLTPLQASWLNLGQGERLRVGPYLLEHAVRVCDFVPCYRARRSDSGEIVRLAMIAEPGPRAGEILGQLQALSSVSQRLPREHTAPIFAAGLDQGRIWAASPWSEGQTAAEFVVHHGRFAPEMVLEVARAMLIGLVALEKAGLCHGDISMTGLWLGPDGTAVLPQPGLRAILRPAEGYAQADLLPTAYASLAPERISAGSPPNAASDAYACGCVWWHLACGRAPIPGGDSLAALRAAQAAAIVDVRQLAYNVPEPLANAISACLRREPGQRPESMAKLAAVLGPPSRNGKRTLARCLANRRMARVSFAPEVSRPRQRLSRWLTAATVALLAAAAVAWPVWTHRGARQVAGPQTDHLPSPSGRWAGGEGAGATIHSTLTPTLSRRERGVTGPADLVLGTAAPIPGRSLQLVTGQRVCPTAGKRATIVVPPAGLSVAVDNVRFENIDFVCDAAVDAPPALLRLSASRAEFRGCSFCGPRSAPPGSAAILWTYPADPASAGLALASGRLRLGGCVVRQTPVAVQCRTAAAVTLEMTNTLSLARGPLVRMDRAPAMDEPLRIVASQLTLRGGGPLVAFDSLPNADRAGEILVEATGCVFAPAAHSALFSFTGSASPQAWLKNLRWSGAGSLLTPDADVAAWHLPDGAQHTLDDTAISIAGLVRSEVEFAGESDGGPAASRITRWQAPLQSADPPGIVAETLPGAAAPQSARSPAANVR
ncbi:MAG: protein kinase [Thermoguttaceae bacterium]|jgi:serine/threonine-protein kinase